MAQVIYMNFNRLRILSDIIPPPPPIKHPYTHKQTQNTQTHTHTRAEYIWGVNGNIVKWTTLKMKKRPTRVIVSFGTLPNPKPACVLKYNRNRWKTPLLVYTFLPRSEKVCGELLKKTSPPTYEAAWTPNLKWKQKVSIWSQFEKDAK